MHENRMSLTILCIFLSELQDFKFIYFAGQLVLNSDIIFLAMKPQHIDEAFKQIHISSNEWTFSKLVISVIAGLSLETLHKVCYILRHIYF